MHRIPLRLNGYDIIAQTLVIENNGLQVSDAQAVILGHDPARRNGKYVTAFVAVADNHPEPREWYWGHYTEDLGVALRQFAIRSNMTMMLCTHKAEVDQHCATAGCLNYFDYTLASL